MINLNFLLVPTTADGGSKTGGGIFTLETLEYCFDIFIVFAIMLGLMYLSFSIVKKSQIEESLEDQEEEMLKTKQKIMLKNQIEVVQNGIVCIDSESYIIPARRNTANRIYDDEIPKIKHLNSVKYDIYDKYEKYDIKKDSES